MSVIRVGSNKQYSDGWDKVFGGKTTNKTTKKKTAKSAKNKPTKKKTAKKKK